MFACGACARDRTPDPRRLPHRRDGGNVGTPRAAPSAAHPDRGRNPRGHRRASEPRSPEAPALVTAPTIEPLPKPAAPVVPVDIPAPDFAEIIQPALPESAAPAERPAPVAPPRRAPQWRRPGSRAGRRRASFVPAPIHDEPKRVPVSGAPQRGSDPVSSSRTAAAVVEKVEASAYRRADGCRARGDACARACSGRKRVGSA